LLIHTLVVLAPPATVILRVSMLLLKILFIQGDIRCCGAV